MRVLWLMAAILAAGCAAPAQPDADVLATFYPLAWTVERIAGPHVTVGTLVPAGVEAHDWEPTPLDAARLGNAKLVVAQGAGFEPWLGGLVSNLGARAPRVLDTTSHIELAPAHEGEDDADDHGDEEFDPHTWLDPVVFSQQVRAMSATMAEMFPDYAGAMSNRTTALLEDLAALDAEMGAGLATCDARVIVANHDAYGYLAERYDFEVVAVSGLSPEAEPDPQAIAAAIDAARGHNLTIIFFEDLVSPRVAEIIASEVGATTRILSPIESRPAEGDYLDLMRQNLANLREAMRCT